jgi:Ca2+-binding EF-hand superfamily protein
MFLLHPPRLKKALEALDADGSGEIDVEEWETAINKGLAKRLEQLAVERERRERAALRDDAEFSTEFLNAARRCFEMIDKDESGTLEKEEIVRAVRADQEVINFLINCGNKNLQYLLVPNRLQAALAAMDTDHDGHIDLCEWETCIEIALQNKLEQRAAAREAQAKAAQKEIAEFTGEFLSAARQCFQLIDKDCGGSLSKSEIVEAVKTDQEVIRFLTTCGEDNLQFLLHPPRLQKALEILDTDNSGEVDEKEWDEAIQRGLSKRLEQLAMERERRERAALRADAEFSTEFLNAARKVFQMIDDDGSGTLEKQEIVTAVKCNQRVIKFLVNCGNPNLQYLLVPARLESALVQMDTDRDGHIDEGEWEEAIEVALSNKLADRAAKREMQAKAAQKEIEEFTLDFKHAARRCFE